MAEYSKTLYMNSESENNKNIIIQNEQYIKGKIESDSQAGIINSAEKFCIDRIIEQGYVNQLFSVGNTDKIIEECTEQLKEIFSEKIIVKCIDYIIDTVYSKKICVAFGHDAKNVIDEINESIACHGDINDISLWKQISFSEEIKSMQMSR